MFVTQDIPNVLYNIIRDIPSITYTVRIPYDSLQNIYSMTFTIFNQFTLTNIPCIITFETNHYHIIEFPSIIDSRFNIQTYTLHKQLKSNKTLNVSNYSKVNNLLNCVKYITKTTNDLTQILYSEPYTKIIESTSFYYYPFILCLLDLCLPTNISTQIFNIHYNLFIFDSNIDIKPTPFHHRCQEYYTSKYYGIDKTMSLYKQRFSFNIEDLTNHLDISYFTHFKLNYNTELSRI
jgi:hypothetical protein